MRKLAIYVFLWVSLYSPIELSRCIIEYNHPFDYRSWFELLFLIWTGYAIALWILINSLRRGAMK